MKKDIWTRKRYPRLKKVWDVFKKIVNFTMWVAFIFLAALAIFSKEIIFVASAPVLLAINLFVFPVFRKTEEINE